MNARINHRRRMPATEPLLYTVAERQKKAGSFRMLIK